MKEPNEYAKGKLVTVEGVFTNPLTGEAVDPTTVTCNVTPPGGTTVPYVYETNDEVVRVEAGLFRMNIDANETGFWYYQWISTGVGQSADEGSFRVRKSNF